MLWIINGLAYHSGAYTISYLLSLNIINECLTMITLYPADTTLTLVEERDSRLCKSGEGRKRPRTGYIHSLTGEVLALCSGAPVEVFL
jgi:hypothetical protein